MSQYPDSPEIFSSLVKRAFKLHYLSLKHIIPCVLTITVLKYLCMLACSLTHSHAAHVVFYLIFTASILYFLFAAFLLAQAAFTDQVISFKEAVTQVWKRAVHIYSVTVLYVFFGGCVYSVIQLMHKGFYKLFPYPESNLQGIFLLITTILSLVYVCMFFYAIPLAVLEKNKLFSNFYRSLILTEKNKLGVICLFFFIFFVLGLVSPGGIQEYLLSVYHLDGVFDFIVLCVAIPLFVNTLLLLIHDSKLQYEVTV